MDANLSPETRYRACAGQAQGFGETPQDALSVLMAQIPADAPSTPIVIWPCNRGIPFKQ